MRDDLKTAIRSLLASKIFTGMVLVVLALGIGAGTAIFSVVDAVVLRGLPFDEHDRLVAVGERWSARPGRANTDPDALSNASPQNYLDWVARQQVFDSIAAVANTSFTLRDRGDEPEELIAQRVSPAFFDVLRVRAAYGRLFTSEDARLEREDIAVISDGLWRRRFGADPNVIGRTLRTDTGTLEIVGIMAAGFQYPVGAVRPTEVWIPFVVPPSQRIRNAGTRSSYLQAIARLKPGLSVQDAQTQMDQVAEALRAEHPEWNRETRFGVRSLVDQIVGARTRSWMLMLLGAVAIVLLIACANVANLLLARATEREREMGVRAALGAGRARLIRQLLTESVLLSAAGTALAVLLAWWGVEVLRTSLPEGIPRVAAIALDLRVLSVAAVLALTTGLLFGIVPAVQLSRPDLVTALKEATRSASASRTRQRLRASLVAGEIALAVILLVGASLFIGSFVALLRVDPGFNPEGVLVAQISPRWEPGTRPPDTAAAFVDLAERLAHLPGVTHAAVISGGIPLGGSSNISAMAVPGGTPVADETINVRRVTNDYHRTMQIGLVAGRYFEATDRQGAQRVVILNETAARKYFPGENPIGRTVEMGGDLTVVGIVGDVHQSSLEAAAAAEAHVPLAQSRTGIAELVVRTTGNPVDLLPAIKATTAVALPGIPLRGVRTLESMVAQQLAQRRLNMLLLGVFGLLGLVISAAGIYGVMAFVVSQRTREIGVRMALGATRGTIIRMVLASAGRMVAAGLAIGSLGAWSLHATAERFLFGLEGDDPRAFLPAVLLLSVIALIASLVPARRAASVDPLHALRAD